jgi:signal transduction histidine kinase
MSGAPDLVAGAISTTQRAIAAAGAGATLIAALAGLVAGRSVSAPILGLATAAGRMGAGDLSARAPVSGSNETALVARQFNQMAVRLEQTFGELAAERDALRRFIADASHELRTPITALKTFNELLTDEPASMSDPVRREFLVESAVQLDRLERVTHDLLDLSRLDAGLASLTFTTELVSELIQEANAGLHAVAAEHGVSLALAPVAPDIELTCDRRRIVTAVTNLLDNALCHTPAGGTVTVSAEQTGQTASGVCTVRITVADTGQGFAPEDLPHVFERFYRGGPGAGHTAAQGTGLGLAIVQSIASAHHGCAWAENDASGPPEGPAGESALGGARVTLELPLSPAPQLVHG